LDKEVNGLGFKIVEQIKKMLGSEGQKEITSVSDITSEDLWGLSSELYIRELAFMTCVNLMGNAISKCEFKTFFGGKETKGPEYYLWSYSPNKNQNSSDFLHKWIYQLYRNNEALVVESGGQLVVADSYACQKFALKDNVFSQVTVDDFQFRRTFTQSEVIFVKLGEQDMRQIVNGLYSAYQKLIDYGMKSYRKSRGTKGVIEMDASVSGDEKFQKSVEELRNKGFRTFAEAENAVLTLYKGLKYTDIGSKTYSNEGTRDIRAMIDDVSDFTAKAFGIPPALLSGQIAGISDAMDQFLTFAVDPLADMLQEEINRKRNGLEGMQKGNYLKIDTRTIRHIDMMNAPAAVEKLISSGAYCVNDIRLMIGDPIINEPWAWEHFITKNYSNIEEALARLKGGESE